MITIQEYWQNDTQTWIKTLAKTWIKTLAKTWIKTLAADFFEIKKDNININIKNERLLFTTNRYWISICLIFYFDVLIQIDWYKGIY